jgi:hypothetical protein
LKAKSQSIQTLHESLKNQKEELTSKLEIAQKCHKDVAAKHTQVLTKSQMDRKLLENINVENVNSSYHVCVLEEQKSQIES